VDKLSLVLYPGFCIRGFVSGVLYQGFCIKGFVSGVLYQGFCIRGLVSRVLYQGTAFSRAAKSAKSIGLQPLRDQFPVSRIRVLFNELQGQDTRHQYRDHPERSEGSAFLPPPPYGFPCPQNRRIGLFTATKAPELFPVTHRNWV
jgi:hypothetical protein